MCFIGRPDTRLLHCHIWLACVRTDWTTAAACDIAAASVWCPDVRQPDVAAESGLACYKQQEPCWKGSSSGSCTAVCALELPFPAVSAILLMTVQSRTYDGAAYRPSNASLLCTLPRQVSAFHGCLSRLRPSQEHPTSRSARCNRLPAIPAAQHQITSSCLQPRPVPESTTLGSCQVALVAAWQVMLS